MAVLKAKNSGYGRHSQLVHGDSLQWANPYMHLWDPGASCDYWAWNWTRNAACKGSDPELFFISDTPQHRAWFADYCSECPVRDQCLQTALDNDEQGWWGGLSRAARIDLLKAGSASS